MNRRALLSLVIGLPAALVLPRRKRELMTATEAAMFDQRERGVFAALRAMYDRLKFDPPGSWPTDEWP